MNKIIISGVVAGIALLLVGIFGLYSTIWFFPALASQYFDPAFAFQSSRNMVFYLHPFVIGMALSWFWSFTKGSLTGAFLVRGLKFGVMYALIATFPMMWLIYSSLSVSLGLVATWLALGLLQGIVAGLVFEFTNP